MTDGSVGRNRSPALTADGGRGERRRRSDSNENAGQNGGRAAAAATPIVEPEEEAQTSDKGLNLKRLKAKKIAELAQIARSFNIEGASNMRKQELIFAILGAQTEQSGSVYGEGVLEVLPDGFGFLRAPDYNYLPGPG